MMAEQKQAKSFVARIWLERESNGGPVWRGHIRHVHGKQEAYFQELTGLYEFLERVSGATGPGVSEFKAAESESSTA